MCCAFCVLQAVEFWGALCDSALPTTIEAKRYLKMIVCPKLDSWSLPSHLLSNLLLKQLSSSRKMQSFIPVFRHSHKIFYSPTLCTTISKSYWNSLQHIFRIWPSLAISTFTTLVQAAVICALDFLWYLLIGISAPALFHYDLFSTQKPEGYF